jgi:hypothetical protein
MPDKKNDHETILTIPKSPFTNPLADLPEPIYQELDPTGLMVDHSYQRYLSPTLVEKIVNDFRRDAFSVLTVSWRDDDTLYVMDGQNRLAAWKKKFGVKPVPCMVHVGLTVKREADIFYYLNGIRNQTKPIDNFKAAVRAEHPKALAILALLRSHKLDIDWDRHGVNSRVVAVGALVAIYGDDGGNLDAVLRILTGAWKGIDSSLSNQFLYGIDRFVRRYQGHFNEADLIDRLGRLTPTEMRKRALDYKALAHDGKLTFALVVKGVYDYKRRTNKLPDWQAEPNYGTSNKYVSGMQARRMTDEQALIVSGKGG